jgi:hypothetical protein
MSSSHAHHLPDVGIVGAFGFASTSAALEARVTLHADAVAFGLLSSALGVGALIGALLLAPGAGEPRTGCSSGRRAFGLFEARSRSLRRNGS